MLKGQNVIYLAYTNQKKTREPILYKIDFRSKNVTRNFIRSDIS